jgi:DNA-binding CsgD family transcriptional regulator
LIVHDTDFISVDYIESKSLLLTKWKQANLTVEQFKQELQYARDWCCNLRVKRTVLNQEHFRFVIPDELYPWIEKEINVPGYKAGVEDFVFVVAKDSQAQLSVMQSFDKVNSIYAPKFFLDHNQAFDWITSNKRGKQLIEPIQPPDEFDPQIDIQLNEDQTKAILQVEIPIDSLPHSLHAIKQHMDKMKFMRENWQKFSKLTKREEGVLRLLVKGLQNSEISEKLFISDKTVKTHRRNIIKKLECKHMVDLYRYADTFGLI